jgi:hypothetical protein
MGQLAQGGGSLEPSTPTQPPTWYLIGLRERVEDRAKDSRVHHG